MGRFVVAAVAALSLLYVAVAGADEPSNAYYRTPSRLPGKRHGDVIRHKALGGEPAVAGAGRTQLVIYRTTDAAGRAVPASGVVSIPKGRTPKGGWPVITWAHGTSGIADQCAPSLDSATAAAHGYNAYIYPLFTRWLKAGYAIVRTDYQGLGTAGDHQYLIGASEGHSVLDMVRAARAALPGALSTNMVISGHSQGGHAALFAAAEAPKYTPELHLRGTVAYAPASHLDEQIPLTTSLTQPNAGLTALVATIGAGLEAAGRSAGVTPVLTPAGSGLVADARTQCLGTLAGTATTQNLTPASLFQQGASFTTLRRLLDAQDPTNLRIASRVRIEQGSADTTVIPLFTDDLAKTLTGRGTPLTYNKVAGIDHAGITSGAGATDGTKYIEKWMPGR
ncbi:lipase family protein [Conexibacter woesei]|uniref:lipase family protein n=1 Tax=Conexibacter woesei TaxID=191495 RepID=UPI0003F4CE1D|nr:lipase family protein [Conexibacter woesei]